MPQTLTVLASASPARLAVLRGAGLNPLVSVSNVDEDALTRNAEHLDALDPLERAEATTCLLASSKARAVAARIARDGLPEAEGADQILVFGCDSMLLVDGRLEGKPHTPEVARERWAAMNGASADLVTGHTLIAIDGPTRRPRAERSAAARTRLHFATVTPAEIDAYIASGEPLEVAGACTLDGLGGPFVTGIEGDYHSVIGLSLPLVRNLAAEMGIFWPSLWEKQAH